MTIVETKSNMKDSTYTEKVLSSKKNTSLPASVINDMPEMPPSSQKRDSSIPEMLSSGKRKSSIQINESIKTCTSKQAKDEKDAKSDGYSETFLSDEDGVREEVLDKRLHILIYQPFTKSL